jgi:hypothetical protein
MCSGQLPPYSCSPRAISTLPQRGYISPPDSCQDLQGEKAEAPTVPQPILEAVDLPHPAPISALQSQPGHTAAPSHLIGQSNAEGQSEPPTPFSIGQSPGSLMRNTSYHHQGQVRSDALRNRLISINTTDSRNSAESFDTGKSPIQSGKKGVTSVSDSQNLSGYDYRTTPSTGSFALPNGFSPATPHHPALYCNIPNIDMRPHVEEFKNGIGAGLMACPSHIDPVKCRLDIYSVERSSNEVRIP